MSLRTKLLAAVVGLPGAILLLALVLFIRADPTTPAATVDRIIHLAMGTSRDAVGPGLLKEVRAGRVRNAYILRDPGKHTEADVWTVEAYYARQAGEEADVTDERLKARLMKYRRRAQGEFPTFTYSQEYLAVNAKLPDAQGRGYGIVVELSSPRSGAQTVYWVMVAGIALMMVISYWLISRLVIHPLARLSAAADQIAAGDYQVKVEGPDRGDEVGRTARALNRMAREIAEYQGHLEDRVLSALGRIKKAEQHLVIAQRLAATGKLASGLAHEINNPLGGMKNAVRALARGDLSEDRTRLYLDLIADGLVRVEQTVKKFLTFTPRSVEPRPTDLTEVVEKSVALAMHRIQKRGIEIATALPSAGAAIVFGDPHELQQVALNLLLNAADAIEVDHQGHIQVVVERTEDEIVLRVQDDGSGMTPEDQSRCFDMFFTTKAVGEGSGMGLAVVHNIVTTHGGRIEVLSELGVGTTFQVFLPAEARGEAPEAGAEDEVG